MCRKKPFISAANALKRMKWAADNAGTNWKEVMFTDECCVKIGEVSGQQHCWRTDGNAYNPATMQVQLRAGKAIHIWGAIRYGKKLPLVRFKLAPARQVKKVKIKAETITAGVYSAQILWGPMISYINQAKAEGVNIRVVEDGAVVHWNGAAGRVRELLPIITQSHPPTSPDLNPIERCWQVVKARLTAMERHATALDELWENVVRIWDEIPQSTIDGFPVYHGDGRQAQTGY
jgi:hypothetical protein